MGILTLVVLLALETLFLVWSIKTKGNKREERGSSALACWRCSHCCLLPGFMNGASVMPRFCSFWSSRHLPQRSY